MTRISLKEAYDNRDVIAQLVGLRDDVDELLNILKDLDPSGDLTNVVTKTGDQTIDGVKTFIGKIVADCDIIQNGGAYETHAEQIYSHNDYIVMRDGQLNGLAAGDYSGLQVKKYNGSDDVRMVVDNTGIMRVGDINDERPIMVRDEAAYLTDGDVLLWDSMNKKAVGQPKDSAPASGSSALVTSNGIYTALSGKGIINSVTENTFSGVSVAGGGSGTIAQSITLTEAGTYLLSGAVTTSTPSSSGYVRAGFRIGGSGLWSYTANATGDGIFFTTNRIATVPANTQIDLSISSSVDTVTVGGELKAVRLI